MSEVTLTADGVSVGDTLTTVVLFPNTEDDREPAAKYKDRTLYISADDDWEPEQGEVVDVRIANIKENTMRGVKVDE